MNKEGMKAGVKEFGVSAFIDVVAISVESDRGMEERKGKKLFPFSRCVLTLPPLCFHPSPPTHHRACTPAPTRSTTH